MNEAGRDLPRPLDRRDGLVAVGFALGATLVYALTAQTRMHGDASWMLVALRDGGPGAFLHPLLFPVQRALRALIGSDVRSSAYLVSHLAGGLGLGATYLLARGLRGSRAGAVLATLLLGATPALWFFATTIEVHALQFAAAACAGCVVLFAPWRRPLLALALTLAVLPVVHASHQFSILMGFGWPALIRVAHERSGRSLSWVRAYGVFGPLCLATLVATQMAITWARHGELGVGVGEETRILSSYHDPGRFFEMAWQGWIVCLGALLPLGIAGGFRRDGLRAAERWTPLIFFGPPVAFLLFVYPVPEHGGFTLGSAPFLAAWGARVLRGGARTAWLPCLALVGGQALFGWGALRAFDHGFDPDERVRLVREVLDGEGLLLVGDHLAPITHFFDPSLLEIDVVAGLRRAGDPAVEPVFERVEAFLRPHVGQRPVAIDLSYGTNPSLRSFLLSDSRDVDRRWMDAFVAWVEAHCVTRRYPDEWWPLLLIEAWR